VAAATGIALFPLGLVGHASVSPVRVGARVRECRLAAGLSQAAVAGERFSKEYVSQIERGKTAPSAAALTWLASRLGTDVEYLQSGVSALDRERAVRAIAKAVGLSDAHEYAAALSVLEEVAGIVGAVDDRPLAGAWVAARGWALVQVGDLDAASVLLEQLTLDGAGAAEIVFLRGVVAYKRSDVEEARQLLDAALALAAATETASDRLRSDIFGWRSRCHRRTRDMEAAREDVELAIEFAVSGGDTRRAAYAYFQGSLVHERMGNWLRSRRDAERARDLFVELGDRANEGRMLNNLGGLTHLLGDSRRALELLDESFLIAVETGSSPDAGHVLCSIAEVRLAGDELEGAERDARKALELFDERVDYLPEIGIAHLTLGRALLEQGRTDEAEVQIRASELSFARIHSPGHEAAASIAQGDLATTRGLTSEAADRYRKAAATLLPDTLLTFADQ
jgi:transcriptional regulator with XRE-family HTH domain